MPVGLRHLRSVGSPLYSRSAISAFYEPEFYEAVVDDLTQPAYSDKKVGPTKYWRIAGVLLPFRDSHSSILRRSERSILHQPKRQPRNRLFQHNRANVLRNRASESMNKINPITARLISCGQTTSKPAPR